MSNKSKNVKFQRTPDGGAALTMRAKGDATFTIRMSPAELRSIAKEVASYHRHLHRQNGMGAEAPEPPAPAIYQACAIILVRRMKKEFVQLMRKRMPAMRVVKKAALKKAKLDAQKSGRPVTRGDVKNGIVFVLEKIEKAGIPWRDLSHPFWGQGAGEIAKKVAASVAGYRVSGGAGRALNLSGPPSISELGSTTAKLIQQGSPASQLMVMKAIKEAREKQLLTREYLQKLATIKKMPDGPQKDAALKKFLGALKQKEAAQKKVRQVKNLKKDAQRATVMAKKALALKDKAVAEAKNAVRSAQAAADQTPPVQMALKQKAQKAVQKAKKAERQAKKAVTVAKLVQQDEKTTVAKLKHKRGLYGPYPLRHPAFD